MDKKIIRINIIIVVFSMFASLFSNIVKADNQKYIQNKGMCWIERDGYYDVGVAYETNDDSPNFQWLSYNIDTKEWTTIADWNKGNWASWKATMGNYWLLCRIQTSDGLVLDEKCICFRYSFDNFGTYAGGKDGGVLLGCNSPVSNPTYYFKIYNLDTQQWEWGSSQKTSWIMWYPKGGNYWTHYEVYSEDGRLIGVKTYCFRVPKLTIAIDPGHCNVHTGARRGNLIEENMTIKLAQYVKNELLSHLGINVIMTHESVSCPYPNEATSGGDIAKRVYNAKNQGADVVVSLHFNAASNSNANGAEVIAQNDSFYPQIGAFSRQLGDIILNHLTYVGLSKRSTYYKNNTKGETDGYGNLVDYFAINYHAKKCGIPGIIVESGFLSGNQDSTWIGTDIGLMNIAKGIANGICQAYSI